MSRLFPPFIGGRGAVGLLVLRLVAGAAFILHGWGKIQNPFHWMDFMHVPSIFQALGALAEFGGGIAWILGLLTPIASLRILCNMVVALALVHLPHGDPFVAAGPGKSSFEPALGYLAVALTLLLVGPGSISLDAQLFGGRGAPGARPPCGAARSA